MFSVPGGEKTEPPKAPKQLILDINAAESLENQIKSKIIDEKREKENFAASPFVISAKNLQKSISKPGSLADFSTVEQTIIEIYDDEDDKSAMPHCFSPYTFDDFEEDIPMPFKRIMYHLYFLWLVHIMINFFNVIGGIIVEDPKIVLFGSFYMLMASVFAYVGWFRSSYVAFSKRSSRHFIFFLYSFLIQFLVTTAQSYGIPDSGLIGLTWTLEKSGELGSAENAYVITGLLVSAAAGCTALLDLILILMIINAYDQLRKYFGGGEWNPEEEVEENNLQLEDLEKILEDTRY